MRRSELRPGDASSACNVAQPLEWHYLILRPFRKRAANPARAAPGSPGSLYEQNVDSSFHVFAYKERLKNTSNAVFYLLILVWFGQNRFVRLGSSALSFSHLICQVLVSLIRVVGGRKV